MNRSFPLSGSPNDPALTRWIESLSPKVKARLVKFGLLDARVVEGGKPLAGHADDFEASLAAKGNTASYVKLVASRVRRVLKDCGFKTWSDISGSRVQTYPAGRRDGKKGMSAQSYNFYLAAFKQFCRWMHRDRRAAESPVEHLQGVNVRTDRRHDRRPFTLEELIWLLGSTEKGPVRGTVSGSDRALLYRVAAETGLRAQELRPLKVSSLSLDARPPTVTVVAAYSEHRKEDVQVLKADTATLPKKHFAANKKMPAAHALKMPTKTYLPRVLKKDLAEAREKWLRTAKTPEEGADMEASNFLRYRDDAGRYTDFHAFRHVTGSFLAAAGVNPKVAQTVLRLADFKLTMNTYSHSYRQDEAQAIESLPDLSRRPQQAEGGAAGGGNNSA